MYTLALAFLTDLSLLKCYTVKACFSGAKRKKGICGAVYREAEAKGAGYMRPPYKSIWYNDGSDDLQIALLFRDYQSRSQFCSFLSQWFLNNPLVVKYGEVSIERGVEIVWIPESDWRSVCHTDYGCADDNSPFHTLADFPAVPASASDSSVSYSVCRDDNLTKYQSIERDSMFTLTCTFPFKCHIRPKSYAPLKDNANNLLALSWTVHEFFDGVHTVDRSTGATDIPLIAIKPPESQDNFTTSIMGEPTEQRTEVEVSIICFNAIVGGVMAKHLREDSTQLSNIEWKVVLFVTDPKTFCECLKWKYEQTLRIWEDLKEQ